MVSEEAPVGNLLKAAGAVGALLPQAASVAIGISFVAYFAGWRDANAYFTALGSPWALSLVPASGFLYLSAGLVSLLLICTFFSVHYLATDSVGVEGLRRCSLAAFVLAVFCLAFGLFVPTTVATPKLVWHLSTFGGICFVVAAAATLGELVFRLNENKLVWTASHALLVYSATFAGVYLAPAQIGTARAQYHLDSFKVALPSVRLIASVQNEDWRLVEIFGESALLMDRQALTTRPLFRVVKANDILSINAINNGTTK